MSPRPTAPQRAPILTPVSKMTKTRSATLDGASDMLWAEQRRSLARRSLPFFVSYYFRTDDDKEFSLQDFHVEFLSIFQDEAGVPQALFLEPASFGKSTLLKIGAIWKLCLDPNIRIALGGKTFDDATRRLRSIKAELEGNQRLIDDFGPFVGPVWKEEQITVAKRTSVANESTITCFGSETNVFGWRADFVLLDDIVTNANSGAHVKDGTRERLRANFHQGVMRMKTVGRSFAVRWVNTVVDLRDLTHEVGRLTDHADPVETAWDTPDGWHVIRRQAINEATNEPLWPSVYGHAEAEKDKATDILMFLKRMQNRCLEPELMTFQQDWFKGNGADLPGCLDYDRSIGEVASGLTTTNGYDPTGSDKETADFAGLVTVAFARTTPEPRPYQVVGIDQFRLKVEDQAERVIATHARFASALTFVEANAVQQWFLQLKSITDASKNQSATLHGAMRIEPHFTGAGNKPDPDIGIPSMASMVKSGLLRFPYGDDKSRSWSDKLIAQMLLHPQGHSGDMLMALWFAILAARKAAKVNTLKVAHRPMGAWTRGFGLSRPAQPRPLVGH